MFRIARGQPYDAKLACAALCFSLLVLLPLASALGSAQASVSACQSSFGCRLQPKRANEARKPQTRPARWTPFALVEASAAAAPAGDHPEARARRRRFQNRTRGAARERDAAARNRARSRCYSGPRGRRRRPAASTAQRIGGTAQAVAAPLAPTTAAPMAAAAPPHAVARRRRCRRRHHGTAAADEAARSSRRTTPPSGQAHAQARGRLRHPAAPWSRASTTSGPTGGAASAAGATTARWSGCDGHCDNWFHFACVGLTRLPRGEWLCQDCKNKPKKKKQKVEEPPPPPPPKKRENPAHSKHERKDREQLEALVERAKPLKFVGGRAPSDHTCSGAGFCSLDPSIFAPLQQLHANIVAALRRGKLLQSWEGKGKDVRERGFAFLPPTMIPVWDRARLERGGLRFGAAQKEGQDFLNDEEANWKCPFIYFPEMSLSKRTGAHAS